MSENFKHFDLRLITPPFESKATDLIIELDYLRNCTPRGTTPSRVFFQMKDIFHMLESIGSARIEGNRTTILEYIETKIERQTSYSEPVKEILNMEHALNFIDDHLNDYPLVNRLFLSELHKIVVQDLMTEGSRNPGEYRRTPVRIGGSNLITPDNSQVSMYIDELLNFISHDDPPKYHLIKTALAHHRFAWIHPFDNGNGRTVRLLTYAMLVKQGFRVHLARILNPTAIFCCDRKKYYTSLARADEGDDQSLLGWCIYMLEGLKREITKIDRLSDYDYVKSHILIPALNYAIERKLITEIEYKILKLTIEKIEIANSDIQQIFPSRNIADISRIIRNLKNKGMIASKIEKGRKYEIRFANNFLLRGIIDALGKNDFLPVED
ncbi:MAG: Fic family protein [Candidatus Aminicenantes bacterium]|nr:Fic family protein [Candidatus Aminicenantes bacterium]